VIFDFDQPIEHVDCQIPDNILDGQSNCDLHRVMKIYDIFVPLCNIREVLILERSSKILKSQSKAIDQGTNWQLMLKLRYRSNQIFTSIIQQYKPNPAT
jgi:hypothetical protein